MGDFHPSFEDGLSSLNLSGNKVVDVYVSTREDIHLNPLYDTESGEKPLPAAQSISRILLVTLTLKELILDSCNISDEAMLIIASSLSNMKCPLETLSLRTNLITSEGAEAIAVELMKEGESGKSLKKLYLDNNPLLDFGAVELAPLFSHSSLHLEDISLIDCKIGVKGCTLIAAELKKSQSVKRFNIRGNYVLEKAEEEEIERVSKAFTEVCQKAPKLESMHFLDYNLDETSIKAMRLIRKKE